MNDQPDYPTVPGSLIRATATDWRTPAVFMLAGDVYDDCDDQTAWICSHEASKYRQTDLTLVEVLHDEGRAQMLVNLPGWDDLTDVDKGCVCLYAWKVDNEGHEYAVDNYPAKFLDHETLRQLTPPEACDYADGFGFDLSMNDMVRYGDGTTDGPEESEMSWDEFHRLYDLAHDAERAR